MSGYYLIGEHLSHSYSKPIHEAFGRYRYDLLPLAPGEVGAFLRAGSFDGLNVTIPYKQTVIPYLDALDETAARIGAVNTVLRRDGKLIGYNTDAPGLQALLSRHGIRLGGKKVLVLGTGGAAKTARFVAEAAGAATVRMVSRGEKPGAIPYPEALSAHSDAEVLINATPVGMSPDPDGLPIDPDRFPRLSAAVDLIYNPLRTRLLLRARQRGAAAAGGLYMLAAQAALSCAIFTGTSVPEETVEQVYRTLRSQTENLVLIGMPGSGKSTVGALVAQRTGRPFVDTDAELVRRRGQSVPELFSRIGEAGFRRLESELLREFSAAGGLVIATGGGAVLDPENVLRLRQNGRLFLLDVPPERLAPSADRPLSDTPEKLAALYAARRPVYAACADVTVSHVDTPETAAEEIASAIGKDVVE